ncbi:MAG: cytochrome c [Chloroflexota bacterium]|nr:cytochrome c [Chloroflexota bacterium]
MTQSTPPTAPSRTLTPAVLLTIALLVIAAAAFFVVLLTFNPSNVTPTTTEEARYTEIVDRLTASGDPTRAEAIMERYACTACHLLGGERVAPPWEPLAALAAGRRPPLTAAEYLYESIVHPAVYVVEGYPASMPQDYGSRMTEAEIADVLVYLLQGGA